MVRWCGPNDDDDDVVRRQVKRMTTSRSSFDEKVIWSYLIQVRPACPTAVSHTCMPVAHNCVQCLRACVFVSVCVHACVYVRGITRFVGASCFFSP